MPISILVLKEDEEAYALSKKLQETSIPIVSIELVEPGLAKNNPKTQSPIQENSVKRENTAPNIKRLKIDDVKLLNPKIARKNRQNTMALWLMPFGFIAGITFSGMTNLHTFSEFGFNFLGSFGEVLIGGLLGMGSGWIGSFFAASSVNPYKKDIESLRKRHEQGKWLLVLKTPLETEIPWKAIKEINPLEIVQLNEL